jgi:hypothetical protein
MKYTDKFLKHFFLIIFSSFLLSACNKKKDEITISGRIFDDSSGQFVSGATVRLSGNGVQSGVYSPDFVHIDTKTTDNDGVFSFTLKKDRSDGFRIAVTKDMYFQEVHEFSSAVFYDADEYDKQIHLKPAGFIQLRVRNAFPDDWDDKIVFYFSNSDLNCSDCCTNTPHTGNGPTFDSTFTCRFYGDTKIVFLRSVTKNQQTNVYFDSLFCPVFSTASYEITY